MPAADPGESVDGETLGAAVEDSSALEQADSEK